MNQLLATQPERAVTPGYGPLVRQLLMLALPVIVEQLFHIVVGLTDTWLANNLPAEPGASVGATRATNAAATAAVGTISYVIWFIGLIVSAIGTGSTALIARAKGARHRRLANSVCGQSVTASLLLGLALAITLFVGARAWITLTGLPPAARDFAMSYLRMLTLAVPFITVMTVANSCLRGAGDTLTPAISMVIVDAVNVFFSFGLTHGKWGLPHWGFEGIAAGTVIAYIVGGLMQFGVLLSGRGGIRLHAHRLRPHWHTMRRVLRIGVPSGLEGLLTWIAQFTIIIVINTMDASNAAAAAHINAVRIEALSYLPGFAFAMAAATMVGQSLGMKDVRRANRATYLAYATGGGLMTLLGLVFIFAGPVFCRWMLKDQPEIALVTARLLFLAGFVQAGFAAAMIFSGALRGAGDTVAVMVLNLASVVIVRLAGVLIVVKVFKLGIVAVWAVLCTELMVRGALLWLRFLTGKWRHVEV